MQSERDHYEVITDTAEFLALQPEWDDLHARSTERRFSQSFTWCNTTWETVEQPRGRHLFCLIGRNQNRLVLVWPFVIYRHLAWSVACPLGGAYAEYTAALVEDDADANKRIDAAWKALRHKCDCDIIHLSSLLPDSELTRILEGEGAARVVDTAPSFAVEWTGYEDWEGYCSSLQGDNRRKQSARNRRRLEKIGVLKFVAVEGGEEAARTIAWILKHKVTQLATAGHRSPWLETDAYRNLLTSAAMRSNDTGSILTFSLRLGDIIVAALMSRVDARRIEMMNAAFDADYGKYGPGQILFEACLRWAFEHKLEFDMRIGDYPYKRSWANREREIVAYSVVNSRWGVAYAPCLRAERRFHETTLLLPTPLRRIVKAVVSRPRMRLDGPSDTAPPRISA